MQHPPAEQLLQIFDELAARDFTERVQRSRINRDVSQYGAVSLLEATHEISDTTELTDQAPTVDVSIYTPEPALEIELQPESAAPTVEELDVCTAGLHAAGNLRTPQHAAKPTTPTTPKPKKNASKAGARTPAKPSTPKVSNTSSAAPIRTNISSSQGGRGSDSAPTDSVGQYLREIGRYSLLTVEDEVRLSKQVQAALALKAELDQRDNTVKPTVEERRVLRIGEAAKRQFIEANLRWVVTLAKRYPLPVGMDLLDLIQEGNLGLEHAVDKFDWRKGFKFSTYSAFWIKQGIGRALDQKSSLIRIPGDKTASLRAALRQAAKDGKELTAEQQVWHQLTSPAYLDKPIGDDGDATLGDLIGGTDNSPEQELMQSQTTVDIEQLLHLLDRRAAYAISARFGLQNGEPASFREIGENLGVTAEAARRIVERSLEKLRGSSTINDLR